MELIAEVREDCILDELEVRDQGQGLGTRAIRQIMATAHAAGALAMFLETAAQASRARSSYKCCSFTAEDPAWTVRARTQMNQIGVAEALIRRRSWIRT